MEMYIFVAGRDGNEYAVDIMPIDPRSTLVRYRDHEIGFVKETATDLYQMIAEELAWFITTVER